MITDTAIHNDDDDDKVRKRNRDSGYKCKRRYKQKIDGGSEEERVSMGIKYEIMSICMEHMNFILPKMLFIISFTLRFFQFHPSIFNFCNVNCNYAKVF